jgi:hypothetical protein
MDNVSIWRTTTSKVYRALTQSNIVQKGSNQQCQGIEGLRCVSGGRYLENGREMSFYVLGAYL